MPDQPASTSIDLTNWPRDPANGRYLCAPGKPMPAGAKGQWAHTSVYSRGVDAIYNYGDLARQAVITYYGIHHDPAMLAATQPLGPRGKEGR